MTGPPTEAAYCIFGLGSNSALGFKTAVDRGLSERVHGHAIPLIPLCVEAREVLSDNLFGAIIRRD